MKVLLVVILKLALIFTISAIASILTLILLSVLPSIIAHTLIELFVPQMFSEWGMFVPIGVFLIELFLLYILVGVIFLFDVFSCLRKRRNQKS